MFVFSLFRTRARKFASFDQVHKLTFAIYAKKIIFAKTILTIATPEVRLTFKQNRNCIVFEWNLRN